MLGVAAIPLRGDLSASVPLLAGPRLIVSRPLARGIPSDYDRRSTGSAPTIRAVTDSMREKLAMPTLPRSTSVWSGQAKAWVLFVAGVAFCLWLAPAPVVDAQEPAKEAPAAAPEAEAPAAPTATAPAASEAAASAASSAASAAEAAAAAP